MTVPTNSVLTIHKQTVLLEPIKDKYYNESPSYVRSSGLAVSKGLVSNAPGATAPPAVGNRGLVSTIGGYTPVAGGIGSATSDTDRQGQDLNDRLTAVQNRMSEVRV